MKNLLIAAAVIAAPSAAIAGPYVEAELNAGFTGSDYEGAVLETHVGVAADLGDSSLLRAGRSCNDLGRRC